MRYWTMNTVSRGGLFKAVRAGLLVAMQRVSRFLMRKGSGRRQVESAGGMGGKSGEVVFPDRWRRRWIGHREESVLDQAAPIVPGRHSHLKPLIGDIVARRSPLQALEPERCEKRDREKRGSRAERPV